MTLRSSLEFLGLATAATATLLHQEPSCDDLRRLIQSTYDFKPSELSEARRRFKSDDVGRVWKLVKAHPKVLAPCLRAELERPDANRWFLHDGSDLLVRVDGTRDALRLQTELWCQDDLDDIQPKSWIETLARRGTQDFDVSVAADRWLANLHRTKFTRDDLVEFTPEDAAAFLVGSMKESKATPALVRIIEQPEHKGRLEALGLLCLQGTELSIAEVRRLAQDSPSPEIRVQAKHFIDDPPLLERAPEQPGLDRTRLLEAMKGDLAGRSSEYIELQYSQGKPWPERWAGVLTSEDAWIVRKLRREAAGSPSRFTRVNYYQYSCLLLTLTWLEEGSK